VAKVTAPFLFVIMPLLSSRRHSREGGNPYALTPEPLAAWRLWIPAFAGMTGEGRMDRQPAGCILAGGRHGAKLFVLN